MENVLTFDQFILEATKQKGEYKKLATKAFDKMTKTKDTKKKKKIMVDLDDSWESEAEKEKAQK